jgi:hypothetical protein
MRISTGITIVLCVAWLAHVAQVAGQDASRTGPGEPQVPASRGVPEPKPQAQPMDYVHIGLESIPSKEEEGLAKQVQKVFELRQPQNPGRQKTFGTMAFQGLTPRNRESHLLKLKGWALQIKRVEPLPDGWRATAHVSAVLRKLDGAFAAAENKHIEVYRFTGDKLTLESESVDLNPSTQEPGYDPSQGLIEMHLVGGIPKPAKIPPFTVTIFLDPTATEDGKALASEVRKVLERSKPENPGRDKTFGKMQMVRRHRNGTPHIWKLKRMGWILCIRSVERIPGGWRATVNVGVRAMTVEAVRSWSRTIISRFTRSGTGS